ncbi:XRE family transcriptional regulator [Acinetobacter radioresistens]|uniref:XRE family transcriptional regulator n=1 Tax=Acinetobacter radioresistens TaxID=40216 RepID=UPI00124D77A5|nr:XRE family transcriptional regulator [Acinetobacter radioresistens]
MNYIEFRRQLGKAGLTTGEFAELVKMSSNAVTNCSKKGVVPSHLAIIAALMAVMADNKLDFRAVFNEIEIEPKKPRGGASKGKFGGSKQIDLPME